MEMLGGDDFNPDNYEFYEEITDKSDASWETYEDMEDNFEISVRDVANLETIDGAEACTLNFGDLPNELILKVFSYSEPKELISSGQVSKRLRTISRDESLWQEVNLSQKIVKTVLLELILNMGCISLNLSNSTILGRLSLLGKSQLRNLNLNDCTNIDVLEELVASCYFLERLEMKYATIAPEMAPCICQNNKTLQILNLYYSVGLQDNYLKIIKSCQELKQVYFGRINDGGLSYGDLSNVAHNISPKVEILDLRDLRITDDHIRIILTRCKKINALYLRGALLTNLSMIKVRGIGNYLKLGGQILMMWGTQSDTAGWYRINQGQLQELSLG